MSANRTQFSINHAALRTNLFSLILLLSASAPVGRAQPTEAPPPSNEARRPQNDRELRYWLENMLVYHHFSVAEVVSATGMTPEEVATAAKKFHLADRKPPVHKAGGPLIVLPYPGGRHPRIGFLEGAINPQRETKVSIFTP